MGSKMPTPPIVDAPPVYDPNNDPELMAMMASMGGGGGAPPQPLMPEAYESDDIDWSAKRAGIQARLTEGTGHGGTSKRTYGNSILTRDPANEADEQGLLADEDEND